MVGLGLSFKNSGLDLDCKIWQSAHLWWKMIVIVFSFLYCKFTKKNQNYFVSRPMCCTNHYQW